MSKIIETQIEIQASPEKVWQILVNSQTYSSWNPFIRSVEGDFNEGDTVRVTLNPPVGGSFVLKPKILKAKFPEIRWRGKLLINGIFDGEHYFRIESISPNVTKFIHGENFSGILVPLVGGMLAKTKLGFELMNEAIKQKAEQ